MFRRKRKKKTYMSVRIRPGKPILMNRSTRRSESLLTCISCNTVSRLKRSWSISNSCNAVLKSILRISGDLSEWRDCTEPAGDFGDNGLPLPFSIATLVTTFGVEGGVDCGELDACVSVPCFTSWWDSLLASDFWNGEAIVVAAVDTRSTGSAITFLKAER